MSGEERLQESLQTLVNSPGAKIINDGVEFLQSKAKLMILLFLAGVITAFSATKSVVSWLIDDSRLPDEVNIIVTSPIEFILLQFQIAVGFGFVIIMIYLILELIRNGSKNAAVKQRLGELKVKPPRLSSTILLTIFSIGLLGLAGLIYSWNFLTPMILQYLTDDAQNAGLTTEWRLAGYVGFIVNLALACVIGFQAPVVTLLTLRFGIASRQELTRYRKHIWFTAFVLGAFLSPPDPLSLFLVAMPVVLLFEAAIIIDRLTKFSNA